MTRPRLGAGVMLPALLLVLLPAVAAAHAERSEETPREGARLDAPPPEVTIDFTEPPTSDFRLTVLDGCGRDVVDQAEVQDRTITASLSAAQPGEWNVRSSVVSGLDGHRTDDAFSFKVRGRADCTQAGDDRDQDEPEAAEGPNTTPFLIGGALTALLVGVAFAARLRS